MFAMMTELFLIFMNGDLQCFPRYLYDDEAE